MFVQKEKYPSGHKGTDSKSVRRRKACVGSNPTFSAIRQMARRYGVFSPLVVRKQSENARNDNLLIRIYLSNSEPSTKYNVEGFFVMFF